MEKTGLRDWLTDARKSRYAEGVSFALVIVFTIASLALINLYYTEIVKYVYIFVPIMLLIIGAMFYKLIFVHPQTQPGRMRYFFEPVVVTNLVRHYLRHKSASELGYRQFRAFRTTLCEVLGLAQSSTTAELKAALRRYPQLDPEVEKLIEKCDSVLTKRLYVRSRFEFVKNQVQIDYVLNRLFTAKIL